MLAQNQNVELTANQRLAIFDQLLGFSHQVTLVSEEKTVELIRNPVNESIQMTVHFFDRPERADYGYSRLGQFLYKLFDPLESRNLGETGDAHLITLTPGV